LREDSILEKILKNGPDVGEGLAKKKEAAYITSWGECGLVGSRCLEKIYFVGRGIGESARQISYERKLFFEEGHAIELAHSDNAQKEAWKKSRRLDQKESPARKIEPCSEKAYTSASGKFG